MGSSCLRGTPWQAPYIVKELTPSDFFDFKQHSFALKHFERDENTDKVEWMKIESPRIIREEPDSLQLRYDFDQNYLKVDLFLGHRKSEQTVAQLQIPKDKAGVPRVKKKQKTKTKTTHLMSLCNTLLLPKQHHQFF